ncbi:MAG: hypothetical protein JW751_24725 [Polyangiaceae bacterium]|nr:hypothetical protein [Polyangiaceae bacterium]
MVCNGVDGADGSSCSVADNGDGTSTITCSDGTTGVVGRADPGTLMIVSVYEPPGEACPSGGTAVHVDFDDDGDGILSPTETTSTTYVCDDDAVTCPGDVTLTSDAELAAFGALGRNVVIGDLTIEDRSLGDPDDLTSLGALWSLNAVTGNLWIWGNSYVTSLTGLDNLALNVEPISTLSPLRNLTTVAGGLAIGRGMLTDLDGLQGITSLGEGLHIRSVEALTSLHGLENLRSVGTQVEIRGNPWLGDLTALSQLTSLTSLLIEANDSLTSLAGLEGITSVPGGVDQYYFFGLRITGNGQLPQCRVDAFAAGLSTVPPSGWVALTPNGSTDPAFCID